MSKKKLQVEGILNELEGASLYFSKPSPLPSPVAEPKNKEVEIAAPDELQTLQTNQIPPPPLKTNRPRKQPLKERLLIPTNERSNVRTNVVTNVQPVDPFKRRERIRHTFDILADQLISLREIALEQEKITGSRVLLGDLVQQALDMFISKEKNKQ